MALLIFVVVLLLVLSVVGWGLSGSDIRPIPPDPPFFPRIDQGSAGNTETSVTAPTETAANTDPTETEADLAEAGLAAGLMTGKLSAADYRQAMSQLAAADAVSRPTIVPPERSP